MNRRNFIKLSSTASAYFMMPIDIVSLLNNSNLDTCLNTSKKLVLIQLQGGNDGLNTLIPLNQYDEYFKLRPTIGLKYNNLIKLGLNSDTNKDSEIGLHPSLTGFKNLYDNGLMRIIQGVGYPTQDKSHFKSTDLWLTGGDGNPANNNNSSGWFAKFFEQYYSDVLNPEKRNFPLGIQLGSPDVSLGFHSNSHKGLSLNLSKQDLSDYSKIIAGLTGNLVPSDNDISASEYGKSLKYVIESTSNTNKFAETICDCFNKKATNNFTYQDSELKGQLSTVAKLISGGLGTKLYVVRLGGFDTHGNQVEPRQTQLGKHADLLKSLSVSVKDFITDLNQQGLGNDVIIATFSEFGRKVKENGNGTDHGEVAPMFLFGNGIKAGISGNNINLAKATSDNNYQVKDIQHDYRQVFSSIIQDWIGTSQQKLDGVFFDKHINESFYDKKIPNMFKEAVVYKNTSNENFSVITPTPLIKENIENQLIISPNPLSNKINITNNFGVIKQVFLCDLKGEILKSWGKIINSTNLSLAIGYYPDGFYILKIITEKTSISKKIIIKH